MAEEEEGARIQHLATSSDNDRRLITFQPGSVIIIRLSPRFNSELEIKIIIIKCLCSVLLLNCNSIESHLSIVTSDRQVIASDWRLLIIVALFQLYILIG